MAMEFIARLESEPRGMYCGAIGLLRPGGDAIFNVAIRTVTLDSVTGEAICGVGGGITWDSAAGDEYAEALVKSRFLDAVPDAGSFRLIETLRLENSNYFLLERHLYRLSESAAYFDFSCDTETCRRQLLTLAQQHRHGTWRVRLTLGATGDIEIAVSAMPGLPNGASAPVFVLAETPVKRDSIWLYHKTTRRTFYEQALAAHPEAFDVLLCNEDGQLTEFTRGNLVLEINGVRYTPPQSCGLLDGTLRRELLESGQLTERILNRGDLKNASRIIFINGLRGEIELHRQQDSQ
jgi:para-aminobenzoate synthetase/4-amino-4-deoxychorismate lyase